jgi:anaerobic selenocysteine-containing dehydrogenase
MDAALDHPATGHATVAGLRAAGGRVSLNVSHVAYPTHAFATPSGKIEFRSDRAAGAGLPALPEAGVQPPEAGLRLAHGRSFAQFHGFYDHGRALPTLAAREAEPELWLAPGDAAARGIADGTWIEMQNGRGQFKARAKVTPRMPEGAVWMRDGWPGFNSLTDGAAVLPEAALAWFPFSVGQGNYGAVVEVAPLPPQD